MTEKELQNKMIAWLNRHNILHYKTHGGIAYVPTGPTVRTGNGNWTCPTGFKMVMYKDSFPDIIVFTNRRVFGIELKTDTGKIRDGQHYNFMNLKNTGFRTYIVRPCMWEGIKKNFLILGDIESAIATETGEYYGSIFE